MRLVISVAYKMLNENDIVKIKEAVSEFFSKITIQVSKIEVDFSLINPTAGQGKDHIEGKDAKGDIKDVVNLDINLEEPQILIGQGGQTLFEIQRLLRMILNKKLSRLETEDPRQQSGQQIFYLNLDINDYKKKKVEYLKNLAKDLADEVALTKQEKALLPMSSYERRIIHAELSQRTDVATESQGEGPDRHIVIKPK